MTTSGTYSYNPTLKDIIEDAYQRCGIEPSKQTAVMVKSAIRSLNLVFIKFANNELNLWTAQEEMLCLQQNQATYTLPAGTVDVLQGFRRSYQRQLSGTASASSGAANNAFDGNFATSCTQSAPNGNISYNYGSGVTQTVTMVGYRSNTTGTFTLNYEGSNNGSSWTSILALPAATYTASNTVWSNITLPQAFQYYRVRESGGSTLAAQEVYFCNNVFDYEMGAFSRNEYEQVVNKSLAGTPTSFYTYRAISPTVSVYPVASDGVTIFRYVRIAQMQDATSGTETADVPYLFIEALIKNLAADLAVKYAPQLVMQLKSDANEALGLASGENRERVPMRISIDASMLC